jgi:hypothetical protein
MTISYFITQIAPAVQHPGLQLIRSGKIKIHYDLEMLWSIWNRLKSGRKAFIIYEATNGIKFVFVAVNMKDGR